jgi:hypothetical protein
MAMRARAGRRADTLASEVLARYGLGEGPRIDPWALAVGLHVAVFDSDRVEDGCVTWAGDGAVVLLARTAPVQRRRFTLAHELGHVLVRDGQPATAALLAAREAFRSEEILCDALAGALLMPRGWISSRFRDSPQRLSVIHTLAVAACVSLSAALVRLREVHGWQRTLLQWRADGGGWIYDAEAGIWPSEQGLIKPSEGSSWALSAHRRSSHLTQIVELPLQVAGEERDVSAEVRFARDRAIVLIDSPGEILAG